MSDKTSQPEKKKAARGFAAMSPEKLRAISSKGGKSAPNETWSFSKDKDLARLAGTKGERMCRLKSACSPSTGLWP